MKNIVLFSFSALIGVLVVSGIYLLTPQAQQKQNAQEIFSSSSPLLFTAENPPNESLKGMMTALSGDIAWESRMATEPGKITAPVQLQQGEKIKTGIDGRVSVEFASVVNLVVSSQTEIEITQTLLNAFVFRQIEGTVFYEKLGEIPLSIRTLHVLVEQESGGSTIFTDKENMFITITVKSGTIRVAYNDLNLKSRVIKISAGNRFDFNDETRVGKITRIR